MNFYKLHCPSCGAMIDVNADIDTFYCTYCGTKLIVSGQDKDTLDAKVRLRIAEKKLDLEYADKEKERHYKLEQDKQNSKHMLVAAIFVAILCAILLILLNSGFFSWRNMIKMTFGF